MPAAPTTRAEVILRRSVRVFTWMVVLAALAYPLDWAVWRIRCALGSGTAELSVSHVTAAELKGNKEEYYWDGNVTMECSRSLFPQGTDSACWYLRRHAEVVARP